MFFKCLVIPGLFIVVAFCESNTTETSKTDVTNETNVFNETNLSEGEDTENDFESWNETDVINIRNLSDGSDEINETNATAARGLKLHLNTSNITFNGTTHLDYTGKRRAVLIINHPSALRVKERNTKRNIEPTKVQSLLYEEYAANDLKLVEYMMYNMEDVSKFFASYLYTEICHIRC